MAWHWFRKHCIYLFFYVGETHLNWKWHGGITRNQFDQRANKFNCFTSSLLNDWYGRDGVRYVYFFFSPLKKGNLGKKIMSKESTTFTSGFSREAHAYQTKLETDEQEECSSPRLRLIYIQRFHLRLFRKGRELYTSHVSILRRRTTTLKSSSSSPPPKKWWSRLENFYDALIPLFQRGYIVKS